MTARDVFAERRAQGLPPTVVDRAVLLRVALIVEGRPVREGAAPCAGGSDNNVILVTTTSPGHDNRGGDDAQRTPPR